MDERIRTSCLVIIASAIVLAAMEYLKEILRPFFVALTFRYLLTPVIEFLSCRSRTSRKVCRSPCGIRLPRPIAIVLAFFLAFWVLLFLGALVARSVALFSSNAQLYSRRVNDAISNAYETWRATLGGGDDPDSDATKFGEALTESLSAGLKELNIPGMIGKLLGSAAKVAEDTVYVLLFLIFMLASEGESAEEEGDEEAGIAAGIGEEASAGGSTQTLVQRIDEQIFTYIRGKAVIACIVASAAAAVYFAVGLDLWLVFGVLTFFLNFIPSVGLFIAVLLPMPMVLLEPGMSVAITFFVPLLTSIIAKDVLEPLLIGHATSLKPIVMLMSIMLFGTIWGMVGMVMAVPMTAVLRIFLKNMGHPLSRFIAEVMGSTGMRRSRGGQGFKAKHPGHML